MIYDFSKIESEEARLESKERFFKIERDRLKPRFFLYVPYISTKYYGFNISDAKPFVYADFISRYKRLTGNNVLFSVGFNNIDARMNDYVVAMNKPLYMLSTTNHEAYKRDLVSLEVGFDQEKEILLSDRDYSLYVESFFLELLKKELISIEPSLIITDEKKVYQKYDYQKKGQDYILEDGTKVNALKRNVVSLDISNIKDDIAKKVEFLNIDYKVKAQIRKKLGYEEGINVFFKLTNDEYLSLSISNPEYICGISYICLNPKYMDVKNYLYDNIDDLETLGGKKILYTGLEAINPISGNHIPVFVSNLYEEPIHMGNPSVSEEDEATCEAYDLPLVFIFDYIDGKRILVNSGILNGYTEEEAHEISLEQLLKDGRANPYERYSLDKVVISSAIRFGIPIPLKNDYKPATLPVIYDIKHDVKLENEEIAERSLIKEFFNDDFVKSLLVSAVALKNNNEIYHFNEPWDKSLCFFKKLDTMIIKDKDMADVLFWHILISCLFEKYFTKDLSFDCDNIVVSLPVLDETGKTINRSNNNIVSILDFINQYGATTLRYFYAKEGYLSQNHTYSEKHIKQMIQELDNIIKIFYYPMDEKCLELDSNYNQMVSECHYYMDKCQVHLYLESILEFSKKAHETKRISRAQAKGFLLFLSIITPALAQKLASDVLNLKEPLLYYNLPE